MELKEKLTLAIIGLMDVPDPAEGENPAPAADAMAEVLCVFAEVMALAHSHRAAMIVTREQHFTVRAGTVSVEGCACQCEANLRHLAAFNIAEKIHSTDVVAAHAAVIAAVSVGTEISALQSNVTMILRAGDHSSLLENREEKGGRGSSSGK